MPYNRGKCDREHAEILLKSIIVILNETWINKDVKANQFIKKATNNKDDQNA